MTPLEYVKERKIVAIVRGLSPEYLIRLGHAFEEGGIGLMEVTYNQSAPETWKDTARGIEAVEKEFGDRLLVGVGTVITLEQVSMTYNAGGCSEGLSCVMPRPGLHQSDPSPAVAHSSDGSRRCEREECG